MNDLYAYEAECEALARHFLAADEPKDALDLDRVRSLAQAIQDAVEDWFGGDGA